MTCRHENFDEYFEKCTDCDTSGEAIHAEQCGQPLVSDGDGGWICIVCDAFLVDVQGVAA